MLCRPHRVPLHTLRLLFPTIMALDEEEPDLLISRPSSVPNAGGGGGVVGSSSSSSSTSLSSSASKSGQAKVSVVMNGHHRGKSSSPSSSGDDDSQQHPHHHQEGSSSSPLVGMGRPAKGRFLELLSPTGAKSIFYTFPLKLGKGSVRRSEVSQQKTFATNDSRRFKSFSL